MWYGLQVEVCGMDYTLKCNMDYRLKCVVWITG